MTAHLCCCSQSLLPSTFEHCICSASGDGIQGTVRVSCITVDDVHQWLTEFQRQSKMTFRVNRTRPATGQRILYNVRDDI